MTKRIPADLNQQLLAVLTTHPQGMSIETLVAHFQDVTSKRTIQRRLANLIEEKYLVSEKQARALRYKLAPANAPVADTATLDQWQNTRENSIPLSPSGAEVRVLISHVISERIPVGYTRSV